MLTVDQIETILYDFIGQGGGYGDTIREYAEKIAALSSDNGATVAAAMLENEVTSTLMDMTVATVLATLITEEGGGRSNIHISPKQMDDMVKNWDYTSELNNGLRTVSISLKPGSDIEKEFHAEAGVMRDESIPVDDAKPQAEPHNYGGSFWVVKTTTHDFANDRIVTVLRNCHDRADAERQCRTALLAQPDRPATVENRYCLHVECPSTGCTPEATSDADKG